MFILQTLENNSTCHFYARYLYLCIYSTQPRGITIFCCKKNEWRHSTDVIAYRCRLGHFVPVRTGELVPSLCDLVKQLLLVVSRATMQSYQIQYDVTQIKMLSLITISQWDTYRIMNLWVGSKIWHAKIKRFTGIFLIYYCLR